MAGPKGKRRKDDELETSLNEKGKKRVCHVGLWNRNVQKKLRNQGKQYTSNDTGNVVPAKEFEVVKQCCKKKCCDQLNEGKQRYIFRTFYKMKSYDNQQHYLAGMMKKRELKTKSQNPKTKNRSCSWEYSVDYKGEKHAVCKTLVFTVLKINVKRLDVLQTKVVSGKGLDDERGKHANRPTKIPQDYWDLLHLFCDLLPHKTAHYSRSKTGRKYFSNPDLNIRSLYEAFEDYFTAVTGEEQIPMKFGTFEVYFNKHLNYSFRLPRSDVCNDCFRAEQGLLTADETTQHKVHEKKVKAYNTLKDQLLQPKVGVLAMEFDYAQNLPLPRIPVTDQFYKRLLWLYLFNVHVHNSNKSFMFHFLEGSAKKGGNSICSFVYDVLNQTASEGNNVLLFSDACGGQNRNTIVLRFLVYCSMTLKITIKQVFPVRGHSYNQCDRNFATYSQKIKKETVEVPSGYVNIVSEVRETGFLMVEGKVYDFETALNNQLFQKPKALLISKACMIDYEPNGSVTIHRSYSGPCEKFNILKPGVQLDGLKVARAKHVGIKPAKMKDVKSLLMYLTQESRDFYDALFAKDADLTGDSSDDSDCGDES